MQFLRTMDSPVTIDDTGKYLLILLIEGRLIKRNGFNMIIGPQPDLLAPSNYTHSEMDDCDKIKVTFISDENTNLRKHGEAFSQMVPTVYTMPTGNASCEELDRLMDCFVDELVTKHFRGDTLNRFAVDSLSVENQLLRIGYRIDTEPLFKLDPSRVIVAHTLKYAENLWAVRSQTVTVK